MSSLKRFVACASAVALAAGTTLAGAGVASAQEEGGESTGSLSSSSLDLGETAADLELAATALNGPVTVTPNEEGGPTVTLANESDAAMHCVGFTMPYAQVDEVGLDPAGAESPLDLLGPVAEIQAMGDMAMLNVGEDGEPASYMAVEGNGVVEAAFPLIGGPAGMAFESGDSVTWEALSPEEPAAAAFLCIPDDAQDRLAAIETFFGIDKQVVADQINGKIPGGSVEPVSAGSISGGSVNAGATVLGSLTSASGGGDVEEPVDPPVEEPAE